MNAWTLTSAALQMAGKLTIYDAVMTLKPLFQFIFQIIYD
jgi:hypothetical protein